MDNDGSRKLCILQVVGPAIAGHYGRTT